jgi:hypothetical protein
MNRRQFIKKSLAFGLGCSFFPMWRPLHGAEGKKKVLVLGIDGMDVHLTSVYMRQGLLPNLRKVVERGSMQTLGTSSARYIRFHSSESCDHGSLPFHVQGHSPRQSITYG